jgi:hypothetical protein
MKKKVIPKITMLNRDQKLDFFTSCNLDSLTLKSVKIQIVFSVKKEQKQQFVLI